MNRKNKSNPMTSYKVKLNIIYILSILFPISLFIIKEYFLELKILIKLGGLWATSHYLLKTKKYANKKLCLKIVRKENTNG